MTHDEYKENKFFTSLTGLRAVAVILVVISHYGGQKATGLSASGLVSLHHYCPHPGVIDANGGH